MKLKALGAAISCIVIVVAFQNCSGVKFSPATATNLSSQSVDGTTDPNPTPTPTNNPPGVIDIGTVPEGKCNTFIELQVVNGQVLSIPARDVNNICYVAKVVSAISFSPASDNPRKDMDIISRNHDITFVDSTVTSHPYILGGNLVRIILKGARTVKLSGGKNDTAKILVDNFILTGIAPSAQIGDPQFFKAYGTKDSSVFNTDGILFKDINIPVKAFATGGTSTITPLDLEGKIEIDREYSFDIRALDAGASGTTSNIYLVFK